MTNEDQSNTTRFIMDHIQDALADLGDVDIALDELGQQLKDAFGTDTGTSEQEEDATFQVGSRPTLSVSNISGSIHIQSGPDGTIHVHAVRRGSSTSRARTRVDFQQIGDEVSIRTRGGSSADRGVVGIVRGASAVDYVITVPERCDVRAKGVSADVTIQGLQGAVAANTVSGDIRMDTVQGAPEIQSTSGDIVASGLAGSLTLRTTSGDVRIQDSNLSSFNAQTVSGDLVIETPLNPSAHYFARTVSGDLQLRVPAGTGATVQMKTVSGDVYVHGLPAEIIKSGKRHWQGRIGGGGAQIEITSVSGDLTVSASGQSSQGSNTGHASYEGEAHVDDNQPQPFEEAHPAPPTPPSPPAPAEGRESVTDVLRLLETGEITVDEAMERLQTAV